MKRTAAGALVLIVLVVVIAVVGRGPQIATEAVQVAVPESPGSAEVLDLDAALYLPAQTPAPAVILAHGFGSDRTSLDGPARRMAEAGYVVLAYSARGFGDSGGVIALNDPAREVADVSALIDLLATRPEVRSEGVVDAVGGGDDPVGGGGDDRVGGDGDDRVGGDGDDPVGGDGDDPVVGIAGGSYGGGLALLAATQEPRLDAVVAAAAWHSLADSLSPNRAGVGSAVGESGVGPGVLEEQWASVLFTSATIGSLIGGGDLTGLLEGPIDLGDPVAAACGRFDPEVCLAYARTATTGVLAAEDAALLDRAALTGRLADITAPTLLLAGQDDTLFGLDESLRNARGITAPLSLQWVAGEHGEAARIDRPQALEWFDVHLRGASTEIPRFSWTDTVAGVPQAREDLPPGVDEDASVVVLALDDGALLPPEDADGRTATAFVHPPGGLPAAVSTLPGAGGLQGLLPAIDLPGQSVSFTTAALTEDLTLLGNPTLRIDVDAPVGEALFFVKLYDVTPGGQATLLQSAVNPVRPATVPAELELVLEPLARRVVAGNRLRLTLASTDQAFADGREPAVMTVSGEPTLVLPRVTQELASALPAWVRITLPVLVVVLGGLAAAWLTRRHERRMVRPIGDPGDTDPVVIRGLVKRYDDGKVAVDGLDLRVGRGQVFGLLGPNGAGKTTTMRMLLGLIHPTEGDIELWGQQVRPGHPVLRRVGVLVEGPGFAPYLTGRQNLRSYWRAGDEPLEEADMARALAVADLGTAIDKPTRTYSHGMRQRLAIAQALLGRPELLVLDEPTDGLDPEQIRAMRQLLARLGEEGLTILVSSHLLAEVEQMCTHAAVVQRGRVVASGPVAELMGSTRSMVITADDREHARSVLQGLLRDDQIGVEGAGLVVELDGTDPADVVAALVRADVRVSAATPRGRLEDTFLALTGGDAADGPRPDQPAGSATGVDDVTAGAR